jgi:uracil-DNA glycosylase
MSSNCTECPLSKHCARAQANHYGTEVVVVVDQVDRSGLHNGMLMNGADADQFQKALRKVDMKRNHVSYVPVIRGQYPGMSRNKFRGQWERSTGKKWGVDVPSPEEACRPWFEEQLTRYENVIAIGPGASKAVLKGNTGFDKTRGTPVFPEETKYGQKVLVTWAGWMLRADPKFVPFFRKDINKAFRFFADELEWSNPKLIEVTPEDWGLRLTQLARDARRRGIAFWDIESSPYDYSINAKGEKTPRYNTLMNPTIVLGMGWKDKAFVANFTTHDWDEADKAAYIKGYGEILSDPDIIKVGHNSFGYDALNMMALYGIEVNNHRDTMIMARIVAPELPKSLAFWAAAATDVAGWKDGADYSDSMYNAMDCGVTQGVYEYLDKLLRKSPQKQAYKKVVRYQQTLNRMCRVGVPIDEAKRAKAEAKYTALRDEKLAFMRSIAGAEFNPRSTKAVEQLLYDTWGLPVPFWTKTGAPACDKDAIIELLGSTLLSEEQRAFLDAFRRYKLAATLLSSYLIPWRAGGAVVRNGRIYPGMNASGTVGSRPSSSNPNMLTTPRVLGEIVSPPEGYVLIETDLSSAEFIYVIHTAKITPLQEAFDNGADLHGTIMEFIVGDALQKLPGYPEGGPASGNKGSGEYKGRRQLQKNFNFASLYSAGPAAKRGILRKDMNSDWDLMNVDLTLAQVTAMDVAFHRAFPELKAWWASLEEAYERDGFIRDDNWGMVRFCPNGYKPTESSNFKAQSSTAAYVNEALMALIDHPLLTPNPEEGTGLFLTVYDSIKAVVREEDAEAAATLMHRAMEVRCERTGLRVNAETEIKYHGGRMEDFTPGDPQ